MGIWSGLALGQLKYKSLPKTASIFWRLKQKQYTTFASNESEGEAVFQLK